ncbi:hypothetical protein Dsin_011846 [Dipteronia sinensis]|uniref:Uncharacterized protein n=1 Tax=Dipteronia sinensis TaxID=43782 RepID=A0AAE0AH62_9ROSI|nr:hypothetical protein Dsin_011846 [Dipteronia sinensis]
MKTLIRRLSRVADSSSYSVLRSDTSAAAAAAAAASTSRSRRSGRGAKLSSFLARRSANSKAVPDGHVPVYVGEEMERFVVSAELLNHPVFVGLLNKSAQEYGYEQKGVLHIPCHVLVFERVMESLRLGIESRDLHDLLSSYDQL